MEWKEGRMSIKEAMAHAKQEGAKMTTPTAIEIIRKQKLGVKIGGRWNVDTYLWKKYIKNGSDNG